MCKNAYSFVRQENEANPLIRLAEDMAKCKIPVNIIMSYFLTSSVTVSVSRQMIVF